MPRIVDTAEYLDTVCALLREGRTQVPVPVKGISMRPFLRDGDLAYLDPIREPVRRGDVVLYRRKNGQYVLHRIYRCLPDGSYLLLGDSQMTLEPVAACQLRAKMTHVRQGKRELHPGDLRWWFYEKPWLWLAPLRRQIGWIHRAMKQENDIQSP